MSGAHRQDGIRTMEALRARCKVDEETGCWLWAGAMNRGSARVWLPDCGVHSMSFALHWIATGLPPKKGALLLPMCRHVNCSNMAHRKMGTRSQLMSLLRPKLDPAHIARIVAGKRAAGGMYSPELRAEIMASTEPSKVIGARHGLHFTHVCKIKRGLAWGGAQGSSVFSWRPA